MRVCLLLLLALATATLGQNVTLLDHCVQGTLRNYCAHIEAPETNCLMLDGTFSVETTTDHTTVDISSILGGGKAPLICQTSLNGACVGCWEVEHAEFIGDELQTCYQLTVTCSGVFTVTEIFDVGCTNTTGCHRGTDTEPTCPENCSNNGRCTEGGYCECYPGFFGETCSAEIDQETGCFTDESEDIQFCLQAEQEDCTQVNIVLNNSADEEPQFWRIPTDAVLTIARADTFNFALRAGCIATFHLDEAAHTADGFSGCISVSADCVGDESFPLYCFALPPPDCPASQVPCYYSTDDTSIVAEAGQAIEMEAGQWLFTTLRKDLQQPLTEVSLSVTMQRGAVAMYERAQCRPSDDTHEAYQLITSPGTAPWVVIDDCDKAVLSGMQRSNLLFFGMYCQPDAADGCAFSFSFSAHTVARLTVSDEPTRRPLWDTTGYQHFQMYLASDPVRLQVQLIYAKRNSASASIFIQQDTCASKSSYLLSQEGSASAVEMRGQEIITYQLDVDPTAEGLVGQPLEITVYLNAACNSAQCGSWTIAAFYIDTDSENLPSVSEPATTGLSSPDESTGSLYTSTSLEPLPTSSTLEGVSTGSSQPEETESQPQPPSDEQQPTDPAINPEKDDTLVVVAASVAGVVVAIVLLLMVIFGVGFIIHKKRTTAKYELGFDDEGLLLGDNDFDL